MKLNLAAATAAAVLALIGVKSATAATITVKNNCGTQIAIGVYPASTYANGGAFLAAGATVTFPSFPVGSGGRVWSRHNCVANGSGPDTCSSGQCGGTGIQCAGSTAAGVSEGEINFNAAGTDWYDVSYVDGLNDPVTIATSTGVSYGCTSKPACTTVLNNGYGGAGDSCQSPCTAAEENIAPYNSNTPLYCCSGANGTSATCPISSWNSGGQGWINGIHSNCPGEYAYAYDDSIGLHTVATGPSYTITFCGGTGGTSSSSSSSSASSTSSSSTSTTSGGSYNGTWQLTPENATSLRLNVKGNGTANGTLLSASTSNGTTAQSFVVSNTGVTPSGDYNISKSGGSFCIQPTGTTSGSTVEIWACSGTAAQAWNITADTTPSGYFQLSPSNATGLRLDNTGTSSGSAVEVVTNNSSSAQQWSGLGGGGGSGGAPNFGPNVYIFTPSTPAATITSTVANIYNQQMTNQFGTQRYAIMFAPGTYNQDLNVGYYTQVLGLGLTPDAVTINGYVQRNAGWNGGNSDVNFWCGLENLAVNPSGSAGTDEWATSQASPVRRVHIVNGNLVMADESVWPPGWASGGFLGDVRIDDAAQPISQQQMMARNSSFASWSNSNWNMVFVGDNGAPGTVWPNGSNTPCNATPAHGQPAGPIEMGTVTGGLCQTPGVNTYTNVGSTPLIREKPYLNVDSSGNYWVFVPSLKTNSTGPDWSGTTNGPGTNLSISTFYIAQSATDNATTINAQLAAGKNILFTPGVYALNGTIQVNNANTVLLGIGLATLQSTNGANAINVADADGVTVAGLILEAASKVTGTLLQVGPTGSAGNHAGNPTLLSDIFSRIGGAVSGSTASSVIVNSNNVIGDDLWLWRADHGSDIGWTVNPATNGLIVNGANVTMYGLAVEHMNQYQTMWNGNGGQMYFYQSEAPYDVPNQAAYMAGTENGYASYKVGSSVTSHKAEGLGIYCYFNVNPAGVILNNAIEAPAVGGISFTDMMTDSLGGVGGIENVCNNTGVSCMNNPGPLPPITGACHNPVTGAAIQCDTLNEEAFLPTCN